MRALIAASALLVNSAIAAPDPHSYANFDQVRVTRAHLDLNVDFERRELAGFVDLSLEQRDPKARELVLDTRDLRIDEVLSVDAEQNYRPTSFKLGAHDAIFGRALRIVLPEATSRVRIRYRTSPEASGLQWLNPALTAGKKDPFLFTQSQAIHARSWVPIQDTPAVRFSFTARITTPKGLLARMGANNNPHDSATGDYRFDMEQPIPSYLLALAVGNLKFAPLGERSGVYAEPVTLDAAAREFVDTERMIEIAENLYGPYRWGRYDLLVLPPSFPFGGMENPRLTFVTPTIIAGDRSLVALIAHELAHSWSGNLVTNAGWNHFWLNEGFTVYVENRIVEAAFGADRADMERELAERDLDGELAELPLSDQHLRLDLKGRDPDEGLTEVAYTKGMTFLRFLEQRFGRETFDPFLRAWFDRNAFGTATTDDFLAFLKSNLIDVHPGKVTGEEIARFVDGPGYPDIAPRTQAQGFVAVDAASADWVSGKSQLASIDTKPWSTQQWMRFIESLPVSTKLTQMAELDQRFKLSKAGNSEVAFAWYMKSIAVDYREAFPAIEDFLSRIGRRKFVLPLFTAMMKNPSQQAFARAVYQKTRDSYHPITRASVDAIM